MRVRTPRLVVKVVSGKRNYKQQSRRDGDAIIRGRKNIFCMCINNTFCSSTKPPVEEEEEEVGSSNSSSARKINMLKEVVVHRLRKIVPEKKIVLGNKGEMTQNLGRSSFNCFVSRFSGMFIRLKKEKKSGFRLMRKWKNKKKKMRMRKSSSVGAVKKRFARMKMKMMMRKECAESEEEEEEEIELCKKRILMGEKCKPLNVSGSLHYDQNGVLLPELLLPCES